MPGKHFGVISFVEWDKSKKHCLLSMFQLLGLQFLFFTFMCVNNDS